MDDNESNNLALHVAVCEARYENLQYRLTVLEEKVNEIHKNIDEFKDFLVQLSIKIGLAVITALCVTVWAIKG